MHVHNSFFSSEFIPETFENDHELNEYKVKNALQQQKFSAELALQETSETLMSLRKSFNIMKSKFKCKNEFTDGGKDKEKIAIQLTKIVQRRLPTIRENMRESLENYRSF